MVLSRTPARRENALLVGAAKRSRQDERQTSALMQALGEFAVFVAQVKRQQQKKKRRTTSATQQQQQQQQQGPPCGVEEKRAMLEWLRSLSAAECSSLCTIVDVGFVKTLLSMAMASKQKRKHTTTIVHIGSEIDEFQLLPVSLKSMDFPIADAKKLLLKNENATSSPPSTSPRYER